MLYGFCKCDYQDKIWLQLRVQALMEDKIRRFTTNIIYSLIIQRQ